MRTLIGRLIYLGIEVVCNVDGRILELCQQKYIRKILSTFEEYLPTVMVGRDSLALQPRHFPPANTQEFAKLLLADSPQTDKDIATMSRLPYGSVIGHLQYVNTCTYPDLAYVISKLSMFLKNCGFAH